MTKREHVRIVAWLNIGMGVMGVLGTLFLTVLGGAVWMSDPYMSTSPDDRFILGIASVIIAVVGGLSFLSVIGGWGLLRGKRWARILVLILSFPGLFAFPVGTLISGYTLWALLSDEES
jgi:uncharacterized membrane protein (DUF2068 family)